MWKPAAVMCALLVASVMAALGGYEFHLRKRFVPVVENWDMQIIRQPLIYSPEIDGFFKRTARPDERGMFKPNEEFITNFVKGANVTLKTIAHTNNVGLLSDHPYTIERDPSRPEFRIAVFGDSFTGIVTATRQWTDYVDKILNTSPSLRRLVNGREFRVLNFGAPGMGFPNFWDTYVDKAKPFDPDMLVVNYIEPDFSRTRPANGQYYLFNTEGQVGQAADFFKRFVEAQPNVLFTLAPLLDDLIGPPQYARTEAVLTQVPAASHRVMRDLMMSFGSVASEAEYRDWYNWPKANDGHMSDKGNDNYARAMAFALGEYLSVHVAGEPFDKMRVAAEVMQTPPDVQREGSAELHVTSNPAYLARLKQTIAKQTIAAHAPLIRSAVWDKLPHLPANPFERDQSVPVAVAGHVPVRYGPGEMDQALLNLVCSSPPLSLSNRHCYHYFIMYSE
jgi:hypothetical protein